MKKYLSARIAAGAMTLASILTLGGTALTVHADSSIPCTQPTPTGNKQQDQQNHLTYIQCVGNYEISTRLTAIQNTESKINSDKVLTQDQKNAIENPLNTDISGLQSLKTNLDGLTISNGDGDAVIAAAQTDVKSIYQTFRIYAVALPVAYGTRATDNEQYYYNNLSSAEEPLQDAINTLKGEGKDVTQLQSDLSSFNSSLASAQSSFSGAQGIINSLTPQSFNNNRQGTIDDEKTARTDIQNAHTSLESARKTMEQMINLIKSMNQQPTPTPTA